jgi:hypothetical protein
MQMGENATNATMPSPTQSPTFEFLGPPSSLAPTSSGWAESSEPRPLAFVGNGNKFSVPLPLGLCEGDCDSDEDCMDALICYQRDGGEETPGCLGNDDTANDYCVHPSELSNQIRTWQDGFQLKLYWEEGYLWQNETIERKW